MTERSAVIEAIRSSWCADTSAEDGWDAGNPAEGQREPSSFVAWRYLGGDLVLGGVLVAGEQVEHHYWNRIDGEDLDLTREQFGSEHVARWSRRPAMVPDVVFIPRDRRRNRAASAGRWLLSVADGANMLDSDPI